MTSSRSGKLLPLAGTAAIFAGVITFAIWQNSQAAKIDDKKDAKVSASEAKAGSWPLFGGTVQRNLVNTVDRNLATSWDPAKGTNIKWSIELGSKAYGGPVVSGGKIFMGTNNNRPRNPRDKTKDGHPIDKGVLMCFRESDGQFLWQAVYDKLAAGRVQDWPDEGICSAPYVEGDRLYYVCNRGEVICGSVDGYSEGKTEPTMKGYTDKTDGGVFWRLDMIKELGVFPHNLSTCSPLVVGDTLFVITSNGVDEGHLNIPAPAAPSFLAIDKKTGKVKWKNNLPSVRAVDPPAGGIKALTTKGLALMHGQWSNPVYAEPTGGKPQIIFPGGDGWMYSFNPANGDLIWKFDCNPKASFYKLGGEGTRNDFVCTPVIADNKLYIGVGQDPEHNKGVGHFWCIDITKVPNNPEKDLSPFSDPKDPNPKFDPKDPKNKDSGLVWHYGGFKLPDDKTYERDYYFGRTMSTCSVHEGLVYAGEYDGVVHCFDANTGKQYWEHDLEKDTWSSPYWVDGKVFIGNEDGKVFIFEHGKEKKLLNTVSMGSGSVVIRVTPVVCSGVMYVCTENPCRMYAIKK